MPFGKYSTWLLAAALAVLVGVSYAFRYLDWGSGLTRGALLMEMAIAIVFLGRPGPLAPVSDRLDRLARLALAGAAALWLNSAVETVVKTARTGIIPQDQGQTSYRAARLILRGENPYGDGVLVDFQGYFDRLPKREAAGLAPTLPRFALDPALRIYDLDLDLAIRPALLPPGPASVETRLLGYKYGPLPVLLAAPFAAAGWPAGVMVVNALAAVALVGVLFLVMRERVGDGRLARLGLAGLLFDNTIRLNYVEHSATDVFALLGCALAVLARQRGRSTLAGAALGLGFGFKIFPCAFLFPLLVKDLKPAPAVAFAAVAGAIYLPAALLDPQGLLHNVFLWPAYLTPDSTSWLFFAPPAVAPVARALGLLGIGFVWFRHLTGREPSLYRTLALAALSALATSGGLHNNYIPWASIWVAAALVERFGPAFAERAAAPAPFCEPLAERRPAL